MSIFDGDWHGYIESALNAPVLELNNKFHLAVNSTNGNLDSASTHGGNSITGTVNDVLNSIVIFENVPGVGEIQYEGTVVYSAVVAGKQRFLACGRFILQSQQEEQEQGTWVITKP